jgi:predicted acyl esterase
MVRFVAALAGLALALPSTASAFGKTDKPVQMSDGVRLATTYYVPDVALSGVPRSARLVVGPARLALPLLTKPISR